MSRWPFTPGISRPHSSFLARLLPAVGTAGQAGRREARVGRRAGTSRGRGLDIAGLPEGRPERATTGPRHRAVVPVRPADLLPATGAAAVRLPLPHRDLYAGPQARIDLDAVVEVEQP